MLASSLPCGILWFWDPENLIYRVAEGLGYMPIPHLWQVGNGSERIHCLNSRLIGGACEDWDGVTKGTQWGEKGTSLVCVGRQNNRDSGSQI